MGHIEPGQVIELGRHRLMCGDAFNSEHVDALMQGDKADMLYCDPPYGISQRTDYKTYWHQGRTKWGKPTDPVVDKNDYPAVLGDDRPFDPSPLITTFDACVEQFWWGANNYCQRLPEGGAWTVWDKRREGKFDRMSGSMHELCWSRQRHQYAIVRVLWCGFYGNQNEPGRRRRHPTHKPVALAEWFLDRYSKEGATVVDLFGGAGGTLLACERKGRTCRMMELSPDYCQVIVDRYEAMTQQQSLFAGEVA